MLAGTGRDVGAPSDFCDSRPVACLRRSRSRRCAALVASFRVDLVASLDDGLAFGLADFSAIDVTDDVGLTGPHAGGDRSQQVGRQVTDRGVAVPVTRHQPDVLRSELRIDKAGVVGGHEQHLAQQRVAGLGDPAVGFSDTGLVHLGHQSGVGADRGQAGEPVRVAEPAGDHRADDRPDARCCCHDPLRVSFGVEVRKSLIDVLDLGGQEDRLLGLDRDVGRELAPIHPLRAPQRQGLPGGGDQRLRGCGSVLATRSGLQEPRQASPRRSTACGSA